MADASLREKKLAFQAASEAIKSFWRLKIDSSIADAGGPRFYARQFGVANELHTNSWRFGKDMRFKGYAIYLTAIDSFFTRGAGPYFT